MGFYHRTKLGRIISRMTSDIDAVRAGVQDVFFVSLVQAGQMLFAGLVMLYTDAVLFCAVLAIAPIIWAINRHFRARLSRAYREQQESFSRITATLAESVNGIRVTQGFVRQEVNAGMFRELVADHFQIAFGAARLAAMFLPLLELNSQFFIAVLLLLGGYRALNPDDRHPVGDLIQFFFMAGLFFQPVQVIGMQYNQALTAMAGAERVFKLLDRPPDWEDEPGALPLPERTAGRVEFRDIGFAYDPGKPVLSGISFTAEPGQTVALVGHTGSGKSSIINLVTKFYLPGEGQLFIDGQEIRAVTTESLHRQMAIVSQKNFLFNSTVAENIRFSRPEATDAELRSVCERLDCLDLFEQLPQGLQTAVGEAGGGLSGGQRQLVCFARALLADPTHPHPRRGDERHRRAHRAASPDSARAARRGAHELRRGASALDHSPRGPRARPGCGADRRARQPPDALAAGRRLRGAVPRIYARRGGVNPPDGLEYGQPQTFTRPPMKTDPLSVLPASRACSPLLPCSPRPPAAKGQTASQFYNEAAMTYNAGDAAGAKQKLRLAIEVDPNFRPAAALLTKIAAEEKQAGAQPMGVSAQTLSKVLVPVEFKDTTLGTAIEILRQRISEKSGGKVEVNFVVKLPPELANKRISLHLDHVPAIEVMRYMGSLAGVDFKVEQYAVMVVPATSQASAASSPAPTP